MPSKKIAVYIRTSSRNQQEISQYSLLPKNLDQDYTYYEDLSTSGTVKFLQRENAQRLYRDAKRGLISHIYVARLDRVSRRASDLIETVNAFSDLGIPITSTQEQFTTLDENGKMTFAASLLLHVLSTFSSITYDEIRTKCALGIQKAKEAGKYKGRQKDSIESPEKYLSKPKPKKIADLLKSGASVRSICRVVEVSPSSIYKVKQMLALQKAA